MSDEQHAETTPAPAPVIGRDVEQLRPHDSATHWGISRMDGEGFERLSFRVSEAGQGIMLEAVDKFSPAYVREKFGPGRYRINWRQLPADSRKSFTLGNDELVIVVPPTQGDAPRASSVPSMTCLACGLALAGRFCASCGTPAGQRAAPPAAPVPAPNTELFKDGVQFATSAMDRTAAIARAEAEERIKRYEIDVKATLDRERMAHEKALKEQAAWFDRVNAGPKFDPDAIVGKIGALVKEEMSGLEARLAELEERLEELDDDDDNEDPDAETAPATPPATDEGKTWNDRIDLAGKVVDKVGAPIVNAIGDVVERIRKGANGAATTNAQSGEST